MFGRVTAHPGWFAGTACARTLLLVTCGGLSLTLPNGPRRYADNVAVTPVPTCQRQCRCVEH